MSTITIHKMIESEILHLPELTPFIGKRVEIVVREELLEAPSGTGDWAAALQAARELEDYDFDALREQRNYDRQHAQEQYP